uniref:Uncharacterized protein n=1 Tax=Oryza glumipatula TaxID=40148 RepID=A0A0E0A976_9ORYZ
MEFFPSRSNRQGGGTPGRWQHTLDGAGGTLEAELLDVGSTDAPAWPSGGGGAHETGEQWSVQWEGAALATGAGRGGDVGNRRGVLGRRRRRVRCEGVVAVALDLAVLGHALLSISVSHSARLGA